MEAGLFENSLFFGGENSFFQTSYQFLDDQCHGRFGFCRCLKYIIKGYFFDFKFSQVFLSLH
jgi:hypothetical protein